MKVVFYAADKPREHMLAKALAEGLTKHGDTFEIRRTGDYGETGSGEDRRFAGPTSDTDVACCFGVKGRSRIIIKDHRAMGLGTLFFDKGYARHKGEGGHTEYSRVSVNGSDPVDYMMKTKRSPERFNKLRFELRPFIRRPYGHVLICSSSEKYHDFHGLPAPNEYAAGLVSRLRKKTDRHLIYRPKPSSTQSQLGVIDTDDPEEVKAALEHYRTLMISKSGVAGTSFSNGNSKMGDALRGCHVVVTHGSASAMDAIINGVPAISLGRSIAYHVSETELEAVESPRTPTDEERQRWCNAMAYCQWTTAELRSGEAWAELKGEVVRQGAKKEKANA